jgi:acetyl esterase/lipase
MGRLGFVCLASEYRLSGESDRPAQIHDVKAAILMRGCRVSSARTGE